jgi:putative ABC transport system ATP-binding protein
LPELAVEGVSKGFPRGGRWMSLLNDVSLELEAGEAGAIVGRRLGGKTTLLRIAAGMQPPDEGKVWLGDQELTGLSDRAMSRLRGRDIVWLSRTCPEDRVRASRFVGGPLAPRSRKQAERIAAQALERVGAQDCSGQLVGALTHWQRLLVALARAFAGGPRLVVIDDLLDVLGRRQTQAASDLLRSLIDESDSPCVVLMSVTDKESALFADRTWRLTRKGTLNDWTGQRKEGTVVDFPQPKDTEGSQTAGSP